MVNDFIANINKSNHLTDRQQCPTESNVKSCKRQNKKPRVKNCFHIDEFEQMLDTPFRRRTNSSEQHKANSERATPTKVKSASWKRSEKSTAPFNTLTNKKHKKSSNWLRFSNSKIKKSDTEQMCNRSESLSACRPGTTYSDVLFGAGCSNLVKIKNCITPRFYSNQSTNGAQKKLTKSLFKFKGNQELHNFTFEESEVEEQKPLFPALQTIKNKLFPASSKIAGNRNNDNTEKTQIPLSSSSSQTANQNKTDEDKVLILPDIENLTLNENETTYSSCLEHHLNHVDNLKTTSTTSANGNKYLFNSITKIPKWNFTCVETGTADGFPKFVYQFEDENYLMAEKMALLGLKLALGNCTLNNK